MDIPDLYKLYVVCNTAAQLIAAIAAALAALITSRAEFIIAAAINIAGLILLGFNLPREITYGVSITCIFVYVWIFWKLMKAIPDRE